MCDARRALMRCIVGKVRIETHWHDGVAVFVGYTADSRDIVEGEESPRPTEAELTYEWDQLPQLYGPGKLAA